MCSLKSLSVILCSQLGSSTCFCLGTNVIFLRDNHSTELTVARTKFRLNICRRNHTNNIEIPSNQATPINKEKRSASV